MKTGPVINRMLPLLALLVSCGGVTISIFLGTVDRSPHSGIDTFRMVVVDDPASWTGLWTEHTSSQVFVPMLPTVDFSSRMVVAVFLGPRPNGCYAVRIEDVQIRSDRAVVHFSEKRPAPDEICTQAITTPAHIVTISRTALPFEFVNTS